VANDRDFIVTEVKKIVKHQPADIDNVIITAIHTGVELIGSIVTSVYDEEEWEHVVSSGDVTAKVDNYSLPARTKYILSAAHIDVTGTEDVYTPLDVLSPADWYDLPNISRVGALESFDYTTQTVTIPIGHLRSGKVNREGKPQFVTRIGKNVYVYPRPDTNEVNNKVRIMLAVKPALLTLATDTNTITEEYPYALIHYVAGLTYAEFGVQSKRDFELTQAGQLISTFATNDELNKLLAQNDIFVGRR